MSIPGSNSHFGDFTVFGFSHDPGFINHRLSFQLGINPRIIEIGSLGQFFFYTSYGDVAESEEAIVLKLGFLRSKAKSALNAKQLLEQKLVGPLSIDTNGFSGNGLVVGLSKTEPIFSAFQTILGIPQLYYYVSSEGIICSDVLRCISRLIPQRVVNEEILPQHFLFRSLPGSYTYFRGVQRILPGQYLKWTSGNFEIRHIRALCDVSTESQYIRDDAQALNLLYESLQDVVNDYLKQVEATGQGLTNLFSGGVNSSLVQFLINTKASQQPSRTISYRIRVPAFDFEAGYAKEASRLLNTEHTFVDVSPQDYPGLLARTIDTLAQPPNLETEPNMLAIAEFTHKTNWPVRYFFTGHGADSLFGETVGRKLKGLQYVRKLPFASKTLRVLGKSLTSVTNRSSMLLKAAEILTTENDPDSFVAPANTMCVYIYGSHLDVLRRCFGDKALREALAYRRSLTQKYSNSQHYLDKVHFVDLFTDTWEEGVQRHQLYLAHYRENAQPFLDEDLLKVALTFHPDLRYMKGFNSKHLLKRILDKKTKAPVAHKVKGGSTVPHDLFLWMKSGPLLSFVENIQRPGFISKTDFDLLDPKTRLLSMDFTYL